MPSHQSQLQGDTPEKKPAALLLIDLLNDLEFEGGDRLLVHALPAARRIALLQQDARRAGIPVIYVNDNFGKWRSDWTRLIRHCLDDGVRGRPIVELLVPDEDDYLVLKPKHSGFYSTSLDVLLRHLETRTVILTGIAGNICVLFTACDAYMRGYDLVVPADCVASNTTEDTRHALAQMAAIFAADVTPSAELDLDALVRAAARS
jgi:nicotinamidase-related amidase